MIDNDFMEIDRIQKIQQIINKYGEDKFYLSFSGGRDSTVLSALIDIALPGNSIPRVFADTGIELNEVRKFVKGCAESDSRIIMIKPSVNVKESLERDGYPFKSKEHSAKWATYRNIGMESRSVRRYLGINDENNNAARFQCPKVLKYQFTPEFDRLNLSDMCCKNMKEKPLRKYESETGRAPITGIMMVEGGRRSGGNHSGCIFFKQNGALKSFHPFSPVSQEFLNYLIQKYGIELCKLYYPPYNFERTGCKGCPFNIKLQKDLDVLQEYFPNERKQCENIWKPVYQEYRRLGYRLRKESEG